MLLYTRTGDKGQTRIIGNQIVAKDDDRVEAYGTIDELNSLTGWLASSTAISDESKATLQTIQQHLFDCGTDIAMPHEPEKYRTKAEYVMWLEREIDAIAARPPAIRAFILPGGHEVASRIHYARAVARRAERRVVTFQNQTESNSIVLQYLNRLSDYFFALARLVNFEQQVCETEYERSGNVFR